MKVNIDGKGRIPGVDRVAPVYNIDLSRDQISRLLNFKNFRVFGVGTGLITRGNLDAAFEASLAETKKVAEEVKPVVEVKKEEPKKAPKAKKKEEVKPVPVVDEPKVEEPILVSVDLAQNEDVAVEETVEVAAPVVEEVTEEVAEDLDDPADEVEEVSEVVEETSEEVVPEEKEFRPRNKKKNKKNRNND
jgi:hypothetical protein